jgi:Fe-S cluster biogenesis protein NfuA
MTTRSDDEIVEEIKSLLESHVKPAVADHGGNIEFVSYSDGHLLLELQGACSGCAGSTMTLKMGVENMLTHYVPEVESVDAQNGFSEVDPFYTDPFMFDTWDTIEMVEVDDESNT